MHDVAITGMGILSAIGLSAGEFHRRVMEGACGIKAAPWSSALPGQRAWRGTARHATLGRVP